MNNQNGENNQQQYGQFYDKFDKLGSWMKVEEQLLWSSGVAEKQMKLQTAVLWNLEEGLSFCLRFVGSKGKMIMICVMRRVIEIQKIFITQ